MSASTRPRKHRVRRLAAGRTVCGMCALLWVENAPEPSGQFQRDEVAAFAPHDGRSSFAQMRERARRRGLVGENVHVVLCSG
jgi:hypothetical protein